MSYYERQLGLSITSQPVSLLQQTKPSTPATASEWDQMMQNWRPATDIAKYVPAIRYWWNVGAQAELETAVNEAIEEVMAGRGYTASDNHTQWYQWIKLEFALAMPETMASSSYWPLVYQEWLDLAPVKEPEPTPLISALTPEQISEPAVSDLLPTAPSEASVIDTIKSKIGSLSTPQLIGLALVAGVAFNVVRDMFRSSPKRKNPCYGRS